MVVHGGGGVTALAVTPQGDFGYLPNYGKDSKRGSRPLFGSDRSSPWTTISLAPGGGILQ